MSSKDIFSLVSIHTNAKTKAKILRIEFGSETSCCRKTATEMEVEKKKQNIFLSAETFRSLFLRPFSALAAAV